MTTLGRREKCLRNRSEKWHLQSSRARRTRNWPLPPPLERPWNKTGLEPCTRKPSGLIGELRSETQNGNSY